MNCGPKGLPPGRLYLYRNNGNGTFTDISAKSGVDKCTGSYCMTVVAADFSNSGWPDIYVACDSTPSFLLQNNKDGTFTDIGMESGVALNEDGMEQAGMGVGVGDYNLDGNLDIFKTHFADDTDILYRNDGKGSFEDVTLRSGLGVETRYVSWGAGITDLDNDGLPDIFRHRQCLSGNRETIARRILLVAANGFSQPGQQFKFEELIAEAGPGVAAPHASRGCAFGDFDNDGDVDAVIINLNEPPSLLRNDLSGDGHWMKVKLTGTTSNRSAIGARVTAHYGKHIQAQEVLSQSGFYSCNDFRLHFGLGPEKETSLKSMADRQERALPKGRGQSTGDDSRR